ncbi:RNA polymerase sigma factor [Planctomycetes bacterium K23_9]|uniref:ECF RNA polymerase sigma factor SigW n=1 Tax=Stieleria marina TaxID=1930275 RepID=A0A517NN65_9BACT|nr:ECF RNA polymerase sigma factor SigW [Planctomycetes bacterium K23_9]
MDDSCAALVRQVQQNDPVAFAQLFGKHYTAVFNRCLRLLGHRQDAEDATQETFSRAVRYIHRWDTRRPLEPWLITIAANRCRTQLSRRQPLVSLSDTNDASADSQATSQIAIRREQQQRDAESLTEEVELAMASLPENHRRAFKLFHEQGCDYQQISLRLGCPIGTAKTWVHRARESMMQKLCDRNVVQAPMTSQTDQPKPRTDSVGADQ